MSRAVAGSPVPNYEALHGAWRVHGTAQGAHRPRRRPLQTLFGWELIGLNGGLRRRGLRVIIRPHNRPMKLMAGGGRPQLIAGVGLTYSFAMVLSETI